MRRMVEHDDEGVVAALSASLRQKEWRVLSVRKAEQLLHKRLFERVYAVRVRAFARNYRGAEVDMHFSLKSDLVTLSEFLGVLQEHGPQGLITRLERGKI